MAGVTKIQREDIINTALDIVRESGLKNVQARNIAKKLNCSTQPIFYQFANMEELKKVLFEKIVEVYRCYLTVDENDDHPYKEMGKGYIRFAKEEPKLFGLIFMNQNDLDTKNFLSHDKETGEKILKHVSSVTGITKKEDISNFHLKMWTFTHGIATMIATKTCKISNEEISKMLTEEFTALMLLEKRKGENNE